MKKEQYFVLVILMLAGFTTIFDLFVVNVAMISIGKSLSASFVEIMLVLVAYELGFGFLLITGGRLGDIFGRRKMYQIGMFCFTVTSLFCAFSPSIYILIFWRFFQGLSAAILFPQIYSSIKSNFNESQAKIAFSCLGVSLGAAAILGQVLGGFLIEINIFNLGWRVIFIINLPIGLFAIYGARFLKSNSKNNNVSLDLNGVLLSSTSIILLLVPILILPFFEWKLVSTLMFLFGMFFLFLFYVYEKFYFSNGNYPLLDLELLKNRAFLIGGSIVFIIYATSTAFPMSMMLLYQEGLSFTPFEAGLLFMPASIGFILSSIITPLIQRKIGNITLLFGAIFYALSYVFLVLINEYLMGHALLVLIFILTMIVIGFSQGTIMTPILNLILSFVEGSSLGSASGLLATLQQIGAAVGTSIVGTIIQINLNNTENHVSSLYQEAFTYGLYFNIAIMSAAVVLIVFLLKISQSTEK